MSRNLKRRVERLEQATGVCGCDDPRVYSYPNTLVEAICMAQMEQDKLQKYLRTRRKRPSSEVCDMFDRLLSQRND